jgi:plastocyanin
MIGALLIGIVAALPLVAEPGAAPRQIVLVARGMTFVLEGQSDVNPTIRVAPGERVRIVLRNETRGIVHDFAIPSWEVAIDPLADGEKGDVSFEVPMSVGTYEYQCRPHAQMMRGSIEVVPR